jgi:oxygen-independent coproporphyrinogen-3 oxidase
MDLTRPYLFDQWQVDANELPFEYFMNRLRLHEAFDISDYAHFTGQPIERIMQQVNKAQEKGLMQQKGDIWQVTAKGHRFLNDLLQLFV